MESEDYQQAVDELEVAGRRVKEAMVYLKDTDTEMYSFAEEIILDILDLISEIKLRF